MTRSVDLPKEARAFLDALAVGESGGKDDDAAYTIYFGGSHFHAPPWPAAFPNWDGVRVGGSMTHAAGRYQFEPATWRQQQAKLKLPDFSPASQDHAAWDLAAAVYHYRENTSLLGVLQAKELSGVASALHSTWTSLNEATLYKRYEAALAKYG